MTCRCSPEVSFLVKEYRKSTVDTAINLHEMPLVLGPIAWVSNSSAGGTVLLNTAISRWVWWNLSKVCKCMWDKISEKLLNLEFRLLDIICKSQSSGSTSLLLNLSFLQISNPHKAFPVPSSHFNRIKMLQKPTCFFHPWGFWAPRINLVTCCTVLPCWSRPVLRCG